MMGPAVGSQDRLFYEFNLEDVVPSDHLLRKIDAVLDLSWLRDELRPYYSHTGCPSIDPELMIRMLIVGYCYSIRWDRRLCQDVRVNLAYRWFCRLGIEDKVPSHSTFSVNRHGRFRDSDVLRQVFESVVCQCMEAGLVGGEGFAVDASVIEADASRFQRIKGSDIDWSDKQLSRRAIREYIDALETENTPLNPDQKPKAMSPTDPTAAWTTRGRNKVMFGYSLNYLIDMENAVIMDVEATPTRITKEVDATETMIERTEDRFGLKPNHIAGDVAYGTGEMLGWLVDRDIEPHIPVWDKSNENKGKYGRDKFTYDKDRDLYICPGDKELKTSGTVHDGTTLKYIAKRSDCSQCSLKPKCTTGRERRVSRDVNQEARDYTQSLMWTEAYWESVIGRKQIERLFGEAKRHLAMTRLRLRGPTGARDEFLLTATVQNLKRLVERLAIPPPRTINA
jgi:transposase